jgi:hypothetical protein
MSDVTKPEWELYRYLGSVGDAINENNFFQAEENVAALKKLLKKSLPTAAAVEIQKRFPDIAKVVKKRQKEPALARIQDAMRKLEPWLP